MTLRTMRPIRGYNQKKSFREVLMQFVWVLIVLFVVAFVVSLVVLFAMLQIRFFSKKFLRVLLWVMWGGVLLWLIYFCMVGLLAAAMLGD